MRVMIKWHFRSKGENGKRRVGVLGEWIEGMDSSFGDHYPNGV